MDYTEHLSYKHTPQEIPLPYTTIPQKLQQFASLTPDKEAIVFLDNRGQRSSVTCKELYDEALLFAKGLSALGVKAKEKVATAIPNCKEWLISTFGTQMAGAIPIHFVFYKRNGEDVINTLNQSTNCSLILLDPGEEDTNWDISKSFVNEFSSNGLIKSLSIPSLRYLATTRNPKNYETLLIKDIVKLGQQNPQIQLPTISPDDVAAIMLTSGSTGVPKQVPYTHFALLVFGYHLCYTFDLEVDDVFYNDRVFSWIVGYPTCFLYFGSKRVTVSKQPHNLTLPEQNKIMAANIENEKCNIAILGGVCIYDMIRNGIPECKQWPLKLVATAGFPIASYYSKITGKLTKSFAISYGTTEIGTIAGITLTTDSSEQKNFVVGKPVPGVEVKIMGFDGKSMVPVNKIGEIYVRHPARPLGYSDPRRNRAVFTETGWYKTDDVGIMMDNGSLIVCGRKSDTINSGGEMISSSYMEMELQEHEGIQSVIVMPVKNIQTFHDICACIVPKPGYNLTESDMDKFYEGKHTIDRATASRKPKYYLFFDKFPKTATGKIARNELLQEVKKRIESRPVN